jgi:hypothetical protein
MGMQAKARQGWHEYKPKHDGNRDDPEPCAMQVRGWPNEVGVAWSSAIGTRAAMSGAGEFDEVPDSVFDVTPDFVRLVLTKCVKGIERYADAEGKPIVTAVDLLERGDWHVCTEVYGYVVRISRLGADDSGN